ncbi:CsbD family protein [Nocardiopsis flavescens]|uniref:Uncharacterized conserved protein YjbJ, UPF0337 family n=1 Tax=Nocardiopsis flavescens TaxID=758803 RepID=A0A1M6B7C3_9ACTN|nr:Uncharacterized conserved protein YjbJ, UPF0337 family [Nocardiopsis flavescens]
MHENPRNGQWPHQDRDDGDDREVTMAEDDKGPNKFDEVRGKAKERLGEATGNREQAAEGRTEKKKAKVKQAGEKVKDALTSDRERP